MCVLIGPPSKVNDLTIPPETITACGFAIQWSGVSSDKECGYVYYIVQIYSEEGIMMFENKTLVNYTDNLDILNSNTMYDVHVTASNDVGNGSAASMTAMTNSK